VKVHTQAGDVTVMQASRLAYNATKAAGEHIVLTLFTDGALFATTFLEEAAARLNAVKQMYKEQMKNKSN
jgi:hypothetical protein